MLTHKRLLYFTGIISIFLLAGCSSLLSPVKTSRITTYELTAVPDFCADRKTHPTTLLIPEPQSSPAFNTTEMAYTVRPYEISYFANNRWSDSPPVMLKSLMVQTLQNTHYFRAVVPAPFVGRYDYILSTQLLKLQQNFCKGRCSSVELVLRAQLINAATNQVIASKQFSVVQAAPYASPYGGVIAANCATKIVLREVAEFSLRHL